MHTRGIGQVVLTARNHSDFIRAGRLAIFQTTGFLFAVDLLTTVLVNIDSGIAVAIGTVNNLSLNNFRPFSLIMVEIV